MKSFMFGPNNNEYIEASYAPSGRAKCRGCKAAIEKEAVRLGQIMEDDHFNARYYYHVNCFKLPPRFKTIDPETQIYKLDNLEGGDVDLVINRIREEVQRINEGKKPIKAKDAKKNREQQAKNKKVEQQKQELPKSRVTRRSTRAKAEQYPQSPAKQSVESRKSIRSKKSTRSASKPLNLKEQAKSSKSASKSRRSESVKAQTKKKKAKKVNMSKGYTAAQKKQFKELVDKYMEKTADELKILLGANSQPRTGNKRELAERCADGKLLGRIPMCSTCGGGKLRFNRDKGIYNCPGYMDDDEFKNCHQRFSMEEITRDSWAQA